MLPHFGEEQAMRKYKTSKELDGAIARLMRVVTAEGVGLVRDERVRRR